MEARTGTAWTTTPTTEVVVNVVNDSAYSVALHGGSLTGSGFTDGALTPDEATLAPGQAGTLHGELTLDCYSDQANNPTQPVVAAIQAASLNGPEATTRLTFGDASFAGEMVRQLCSALHNAVDVSTKAVTIGGGVAVQAIVHNVTGQPLEVNVMPSINMNDRPATLETIDPGSMITFTLTKAEACDTGAVTSPTLDSGIIAMYTVYVKALTGGYEMGLRQLLPSDPRLSALCHD
jgi:hypothetical protein